MVVGRIISVAKNIAQKTGTIAQITENKNVKNLIVKNTKLGTVFSAFHAKDGNWGIRFSQPVTSSGGFNGSLKSKEGKYICKTDLNIPDISTVKTKVAKMAERITNRAATALKEIRASLRK